MKRHHDAFSEIIKNKRVLNLLAQETRDFNIADINTIITLALEKELCKNNDVVSVSFTEIGEQLINLKKNKIRARL